MNQTARAMWIVFVLLTFGSIAGTVEITIEPMFWTLSPHTSVLETNVEKFIDASIQQEIAPVLGEILTTSYQSEVDFDSSGVGIGGSAYIPLAGDRFGIRVQGSYAALDLPFTATAKQNVNLSRFELATVTTTAHGTARIRTVHLTAAGEWSFYRTERWRLAVAGGIGILPLDGRITLQGETRVQTPIGSWDFDNDVDETMDQLREDGVDVTSALVTPLASFSVQRALFRHGGARAELAISPGLFFRAGIYLAP